MQLTVSTTLLHGGTFSFMYTALPFSSNHIKSRLYSILSIHTSWRSGASCLISMAVSNGSLSCLNVSHLCCSAAVSAISTVMTSWSIRTVPFGKPVFLSLISDGTNAMPRAPTATAATITGINTVDLRATDTMHAKNNLNFVFCSVQQKM